MKYIVEDENGRKYEFESESSLRKWMEEDEKYPEPNVGLWGLNETLKSQGEVALYDTPDESDTWATAIIRFAEAV